MHAYIAVGIHCRLSILYDNSPTGHLLVCFPPFTNRLSLKEEGYAFLQNHILLSSRKDYFTSRKHHIRGRRAT